jgi:RimJ/RimL family protein N-acetyltransferase
VVWAVHATLPAGLANELEALAREESPTTQFRSEPLHAERYRALLRARAGAAGAGRAFHGPAFEFPSSTDAHGETVLVHDEQQLSGNFAGWIPGEIAAGRAPVFAVIEDGWPVSICFCARRGEHAAEAGVETAPAFRGRGYATRVTAAWAASIRASGRTPLYSTQWTNTASLGVARRLGLVAYASFWNLSA